MRGTMKRVSLLRARARAAFLLHTLLGFGVAFLFACLATMSAAQDADEADFLYKSLTAAELHQFKAAMAGYRPSTAEILRIEKTKEDFDTAFDSKNYLAAERALNDNFSTVSIIPMMPHAILSVYANEFGILASYALEVDDYDAALRLANEALSIIAKYGNKEGYAVNAYVNRALAKHGQVDYSGSRLDALEALKIYQTSTISDFKNRAATAINLAEILSRVGLTKEPYDTLTDLQNASGWQTLPKEYQLAAYEGLGLVAKSRRLVGQALSSYEAALGIASADVELCKTHCVTDQDALARLEFFFGNSAAAIPYFEDLIKKEKTIWPTGDRVLGYDMSFLVMAYSRVGRLSEANERMGELEKLLDKNPLTEASRELYQQAAYAYENVGEFDKAAALWRRLADTTEKKSLLRWYFVGEGRNLRYAHKWDQALRELKRAQSAYVPGSQGTDDDEGVEIADVLLETGQYSAAVREYRKHCGSLNPGGYGSSTKENPNFAQMRGMAGDSVCNGELAMALWKEADAKKETALDGAALRDAFVAAQYSAYSPSEFALGRASARGVAASQGAGDLAEQFEDALTQQDAINLRLHDFAASSDKSVDKQRTRLRGELEKVQQEITSRAAELTERVPAYWDLRDVKPITIDQLQRVSGREPSLLNRNEALILYFASGGDSKALVFAVTREHAAWAPAKLTSDEVDARVRALRAQIDPLGYGVSAEDRASLAQLCPEDVEDERNSDLAFCRKLAFELYDAILGDPSIQQVIGDKRTLLFVPANGLVSLPPGILITAPPAGGPIGDRDQQLLRQSAWLLRTKSVAILPAPSSLRIIRGVPPVAHQEADEPLLALTDPDFTGTGGSTKPTCELAKRPLQRTAQQGRAAHELAELKPLPGTVCEGDALAAVLHGGTVLYGPQSSKAALDDWNRDGRLRRVRVLDLATHGLLRGDFGLSEPGLALAATTRSSAGQIQNTEDIVRNVLTASEAARLKLNAEWVVLSACNTADPNREASGGISGLSNAFLFAGAQAVLASHWRVNDMLAKKLVPDVFRFDSDGTTGGSLRAEAVRSASLAVLDDTSLPAAHPAFWAPFVLIGNPGEEDRPRH